MGETGVEAKGRKVRSIVAMALEELASGSKSFIFVMKRDKAKGSISGVGLIKYEFGEKNQTSRTSQSPL